MTDYIDEAFQAWSEGAVWGIGEEAFRAGYAAGVASCEGAADTVPMPQNEAQAEAMAKLGMMWLEQNAPHKLKSAHPDSGKVGLSVGRFDSLAGRGMHELRLDELADYVVSIVGDPSAFRPALDWIVAELERKTNDERHIATQCDRLRKIASHVPALVYIKAKEAAGYGTVVRPLDAGIIGTALGKINYAAAVATAATAKDSLTVASPAPQAPIPMVLHCPKCGMQHLDVPEHWDGKVEVHKSHLCVPAAGGCGHIWRPADVPTTGVAAVQTKGKADSPIVSPAPQAGEAVAWQWQTNSGDWHRADSEKQAREFAEYHGTEVRAPTLPVAKVPLSGAPLRDQVIAARREGFLEALSQGTHHAMWALLRRAMRQLDAWQKAYGAADPEWLPPAGDVQLMEDYAAFTSASTDTKSAPESGWRPIETAPKDGTEVLLWREDCGVMIGCYTSPDAFLSQQEIDRTCREHPEESDDWLFQEDWFGGSWQEGGWRLEGSEVPTHWMPLPPPPTFPDHKETT